MMKLKEERYLRDSNSITPREFQVYMILVSTSLTTRQIGLELGISHYTVTSHTKALFDLLGVGTRLELMSQYLCREHFPPKKPCGRAGIDTAQPDGAPDNSPE